MGQYASAAVASLLPAGDLTACVEAAAAAPSIYNSQPWLFRVWQGAVEVFPDRRRVLDVIDPGGRELLISIGAALMNLRVAMLALGRRPVVDLFPAGEPGIIARVSPGPPFAPGPAVRALAHAISRRHTNRGPFAATAIPDSVTAELVAVAAAEGALLRVLDATHRTIVFALAHAAQEVARADPDRRTESARWTILRGERSDGVPSDTFGPRDQLGRLPLRDFGLGRADLPRPGARFESHPTIAVLYTTGDSRRNWVEAGQALQRILLTATVRGLAAQPMTEVLEVPQLRTLASDATAERFAQVVLRLGYGAPGRPAPRRQLADLLLTSSACPFGAAPRGRPRPGRPRRR